MYIVQILAKTNNPNLQNDFYCYNIKFEFHWDNSIYVDCNGDIRVFHIDDELFNYTFQSQGPITFQNSSFHYDNNFINNFLKILNYDESSQITFIDFFDTNVVDMFLNKTTPINAMIKYQWRNYLDEDNDICIWENDTLYSKYIVGLDEIDYWRKVCLNNNGYLYYYYPPDYELINISFKSSVIMIVLIVVGIVVLIIGLFFIALCRIHLCDGFSMFGWVSDDSLSF